MKVILILILILLVMIHCIVMLVKIEVTGKYFDMLLEAAHAYNLDCIERGTIAEIYNYFDIFPSFDTVLFRYFDWGYENILPKEVMEKIRPFIKEDTRRC